MVVVDVVAAVLLAVALLVGIQRGFVASLGALLGLTAGALAGYWLMPIVDDALPPESWRPVAVIAVGVLLLFVGTALGSMLGGRLRREIDRIKLRWLDRTLGGAVSLVVAALAMSLIGSSVAVTGTPVLSSAIASSRVLTAIDDLMPTPVATAMAQVRAAVFDQGIPQLGALLEAESEPTAPPVALDDPALERAAASVARVSGTAVECGRTVTGSGFVIAEDRLITNAHVVAGVTKPLVELPGRAAREGSVVYFNPVDDLAVIAFDDQDAPVLPVAATLQPGSAAVVQGYPYGGPFTSTNAAVLSVGSAEVPDIYDSGESRREIYALAARVQPGNSGGPLLTAGGDAAGVVFARDQTDDGRGYAMAPSVFAPVVTQAPGLSAPVSTGACAS